MQKNWRKKILTGIGILAGAFVLSTAVDPTSVSAEPDAMEEIIGHGEWKQDGDQWYYYQDGEMLKNCWVKDGINWFILNKDGSMKADELLVIDGDLYYFRSWGAMLYNSWHMDAAGNLYYFRDWGAALNIGWRQMDGEWYYFDQETCAAYADTIRKIDNDVYGFDADGKMLHDCWAEADGSHYYFRGWGGAFHDQTVTIDGKEYVFDSSCNGVLKEEEPEEIKVTEITVSGQTEMYVGDTKKLEAAVLPENASDKKVTWTSDNEEIITTTEDGTITAVKAGTAVITAKAADGSEVTVTLEITVTEKPVAVTEITITGQNVMTVGDSQILKLDIQPETAANQEVTWSSDHPEILAVIQKGKAEAKIPGTATITAEAEDGSGVKGTIQIAVEETIVEAESLTITGIEGDTLHLTEAGQTVQLGAEILPENTTDKTITWETDQPEVITIDETGLVTAKTNGTAKITAKTTNGIKAELTVTVEITSEETTPPEETSPEVIPPETTSPETTLTEE